MARKRKYLDLTHKLAEISEWEIEGSLDSAISTLQNLKEDFGSKGYDSLWLDKEVEYGYYNEMSTSYILYGTRKETDAEYDKRMEKNRKTRQKRKEDAARKLEEEKKEYERLKEKFEGK